MILDLRDRLAGPALAPVVTAVAVLSLALGIGANTAMFSILHSRLLRSLPVREPQQLAVMGEDRSTSWTNPIWEQVRDHQDQFGRAAGWSMGRFNIAGGGEEARFVAMLLYGVQPRDPITLIAATLVLLVVGGLAGLIAARRAARLDPASVLRQG